MKIKQLIAVIYAAALISCPPQPALAERTSSKKGRVFVPRPTNLPSKL